ncbi:MAG: dihydrolipoyllysine-residue acetyltransferase [Candidatus Endonucleobacter sp. (ex Gigantidas childressi)]|nr:dihydrolipoyllysine-residue acetyltransferase [Candidatus Endonucleobacter sp. (ex Gigantidas childressi)]
MSEEIIKIPNIGSDNAEVTEISVSPGEYIEVGDELIVLESDKASMEIPASKAGTVVDIILKVGDMVSEGDDLLTLLLDTANADKSKSNELFKAQVPTSPPAPTSAPASVPVVSAEPYLTDIKVPDIGAEDVIIIEVCVKVEDILAEGDSMIVLESDKATMEIPAPMAGVVESIKVSDGDKVNCGDIILKLKVSNDMSIQAVAPKTSTTTTEPIKPEHTPTKTELAPVNIPPLEKVNRQFHAGPAVRKLVREFGVDLAMVKGSGPKDRIIKKDVQDYVKVKLRESHSVGSVATTGIPQIPAIDFSQWGDIEEQPLPKLRTIAAQNFQRSWLNVPHVTQFEEADITELEVFRTEQKPMAQARGTKLTLLPFILKACAYVLKELSQFCGSLSPDGKSIIYKHYINIGVAVDTPAGLLVPVIKNVDQKCLWELAEECIEMAVKARNKKLKPAEMQGGCFTISSLGAIGGTSFTPIVNAPEVAILGLSKASMKPVWNGESFEAKLILPLSLSYDHRAINGAEAARFTAMMSTILADIRKMLL